jgi:hypothetical protein
MIVFGGINGSTWLADTWALTLGVSPAWSQLPTTGAIPARFAHTAAYDSRVDRMLVYAGHTSGSLVSDLWSLPLGGPPDWTRLAEDTPPRDRELPASLYDPESNQFVVVGGGGSQPHTYRSALWRLSLAGPLAVPGAGPIAQTIRLRATPNPARSGVRFEIGLPAAGRARLEIFDVSGRKVARVLDGWLQAGVRSASWAGVTVAGLRAPAGVYLARLSVEHRAVTRRFAWTP